jgi:5-methylcytosine-specific restriction endonuclease McrA
MTLYPYFGFMTTHGLIGRKQSPEHVAKRAKAVAEARKRNGTAGRKAGFTVPEEHRRKISESMKGRPSPFVGRTHTDESKARISENNRIQFLRRHAELIDFLTKNYPSADVHSVVRWMIKKKQNASYRHKDWLLTDIQAATLHCSPCVYCGGESTGIDRIDSSLPYQPDNCVAACQTCNVIKGTMSVSEFRAHIQKWAANIKI